jgi:uncharacterized SAM-binding protein YcdF (DUF218 family)
MIWRSVAKALLLPPTALLLIALVGLVLMPRAPRLGRALAWTGCGILFLLCVPFVAAVLARAWVGPLEPLDLSRGAKAQAIVVLASGIRHHAPEYGGETLSTATLERVRYAAHLVRFLPLPVLVSGGARDRGAPEALLMRQVLLREFGVQVRFVEATSRNTHENAQRSAAILRGARIHDVVLIAHAVDMRRAQAEFAAAGLTTVAAPIDLPPPLQPRLLDFVPGIAGLEGSWRVLYEMAGELARRVRVFVAAPAAAPVTGTAAGTPATAPSWPPPRHAP